MAKLSEEIIQAARQLRQEGKSEREIARTLGISNGSAHNILTGLKRGKPAAPKITSGEKPAPEPHSGAVAESSLPSPYQKFHELGKSVGIEEPLLSAASDYIFRLQPDDPQMVLDNLKGIVRVDLARSWAKLWSGWLGKPLKIDFESSGESGERFSVVGTSIMRDPEGTTHAQALKELEVRLRGDSDHRGNWLDDLTKLVKVIETLGLRSNNQGNSIIQLKDGQLSLSELLKLKTWEADNAREDEKAKRGGEIASGFADLIKKAGKAFARMSEEGGK